MQVRTFFSSTRSAKSAFPNQNPAHLILALLMNLPAPVFAVVKSGVLYQDDYFKKLAEKFGFFIQFVLPVVLLSHIMS